MSQPRNASSGCASCGCASCACSADLSCDCCSGIAVATPVAEANRPGLPALSYRVGTHATFMESMLARLTGLALDVAASDGSNVNSEATQRIYPLKGLTTRAEDDPSIALLDAWATVGDVLSFYQERIANEGYLRTAAERFSVSQLARLVGYRLRPGVAASVYLAFNVADGFRGDLPMGTRAQSVPDAGELPQFFEIDENLPTRDTWNNLKPRLTRPQLITTPFQASPAAAGSNAPIGSEADIIDTLYFQGTSTNLKNGDALLIVLDRDSGQQVVRFIESVKPQPMQNRTEVTLQQDPFVVQYGHQVLDNVKNALQPYIEETGGVFSGNQVAEQVAAILQVLLNALAASDGTPEAAEPLVRDVLAQIRDKHDLAVRRSFTRLEPWLNMLLTTVETLVEQIPQLDISPLPPGGPPVAAAASSMLISALSNLDALLAPLSLPPSLQPANARRLARTITQAFAPQSDMAPRLLANFRPIAAPSLYQAWSKLGTAGGDVTVYAMRVKAPLFGHNAPPRITGVANGVVTAYGEWPVAVAATTGTPARYHEKNDVVSLDAAYDKIHQQDWIVVDTRAVDSAATKIVPTPGLLVAKAGGSTATVSRSDYGMSGKTTRINLLDPASLDTVNWLDVFSANAANSVDFDAIRNTTVYAQAEALTLAEEPLDADIEGDTLELADLYDGLESGRWIIVSGERTDIPEVSGVAASELVMVAAVAQGTRTAACAVFPGTAAPIPFAQVYYTSDPNSAGDRLVVGKLAKNFSPSQIPQAAIPNQQFCDQVQLADGLYANAYVPTDAERSGSFSAFTGMLLDPQTRLPFPDGQIPSSQFMSEGLWAWRISSGATHTILTLANKLAYSYDAATVVIYGNVAKASQGQTVGEVLGNGDASQALQKFDLHQTPLTYLPAPTPAGAQSTLELRVNDVLWHEADTLDGLQPTARSYILQTDSSEDGDTTSIIFGNGRQGARLPTGSANVKATYRYGMGKAGNVKARQISQLATHPLGVQDVVNPLAASGGADADSRDQARRNAPLAVMALDRLVSTQDYADFTRTYAGISKASATRLTDGRRQVVHVSIAGADDIPIDFNSDLYRNLLQALRQFGDAQQALQVVPRRLKVLVLHAGVQMQPDYLWEAVEPKIRAALLEAFGFDQRELGQSAYQSEAIGAIQQVEGVAYADLKIFDAVAEGISVGQLASLAGSLTLQPHIEAELARIDPGATDFSKRILAAELAIFTPAIPDTLILTEIRR